MRERIPHLNKAGIQEILSFEEWLPEVSPTFSWHWKHLIAIRKQIDRIISGEINKMMLFVPPRHGKSELVTVRLPAWILERWPEKRIITGAYNQTLANKFSRKTRKIAMPRIAISKDRTAVDDWETEEGGGYRAVGVGAGVTGMGGDLILIDDPVKNRQEANSPTYRDKVEEWYTDDLYTRLEPGGAIILIMTRWHEDDLAGRILASEDGPNWTVVNFPAIAEEDDPLGRDVGEALCPERYDEIALAKIKLVLRNNFNALYQQRPSAMEGDIFKREWWAYHNETPELEFIVQSWDTAFKKGEENDSSSCTTWGATKTTIYLLDRWNRKVEFPELKREVKAQYNKYIPHVVLIEDKASGQSLIQELKKDTNLPIKAIKVDKDKTARAYAVTPTIESGRVSLPERAPWLTDYLDILANFPNGSEDDDVDSTTQALNYLRTKLGFKKAFEEFAEAAKEHEIKLHDWREMKHHGHYECAKCKRKVLAAKGNPQEIAEGAGIGECEPDASH